MAPRKQSVAAKTKLRERESSIDRARVRDAVDPKTGKKIRVLKWNGLLPGDAKPTARRTQGGPRESDTAIRDRARAKWNEMLEAHDRGAISGWTPKRSVGDFCEAVVRPGIEGSTELGEGTKKDYLSALRALLGECEGHRLDGRHEGVRHEEALARKTIDAGLWGVQLKKTLREVAVLHGPSTAKMARSVLSAWVIREAKNYRLITDDPIRGERISFKDTKRPSERDGKVVFLTPPEYHRVVRHLLTLDPATMVDAPKRGVWTLEHRVQMQRNIIDLALIQAATGLRINEARQVRRELVHDGEDGMWIDVDESIAKGSQPRLAYVLDDRVVERIRELLAAHPDDDPGNPLVGQAGDRSKVWDESKIRSLTRALYDDLAEALDIPKLSIKTLLTHIWRPTLRMRLISAGIAESVILRQLGHTEAVASKHYTGAMPPEVAAAARTLISLDPAAAGH